MKEIYHVHCIRRDGTPAHVEVVLDATALAQYLAHRAANARALVKRKPADQHQARLAGGLAVARVLSRADLPPNVTLVASGIATAGITEQEG